MNVAKAKHRNNSSDHDKRTHRSSSDTVTASMPRCGERGSGSDWIYTTREVLTPEAPNPCFLGGRLPRLSTVLAAGLAEGWDLSAMVERMRGRLNDKEHGTEDDQDGRVGGSPARGKRERDAPVMRDWEDGREEGRKAWEGGVGRADKDLTAESRAGRQNDGEESSSRQQAAASRARTDRPKGAGWRFGYVCLQTATCHLPPATSACQTDTHIHTHTHPRSERGESESIKGLRLRATTSQKNRDLLPDLATWQHSKSWPCRILHPSLQHSHCTPFSRRRYRWAQCQQEAASGLAVMQSRILLSMLVAQSGEVRMMPLRVITTLKIEFLCFGGEVREGGSAGDGGMWFSRFLWKHALAVSGKSRSVTTASAQTLALPSGLAEADWQTG